MNFRTTYVLFAVLFAFLGVMLPPSFFGTAPSVEQVDYVLTKRA